MYAKLFVISILFMGITNPEITYTAESEVIPIVTEKKLNKTEVEYLARIIYAEGSVCKSDYEAIAHVVMVRAKAKNKNIIEIISNKKQFNGYKSKKWYQTPAPEAYNAAKKALTNQLWDKYPHNLYYFHNPKDATDRKWVNYISQYSVGMIGQHEFCINHKI
jgi:spore germination cell wall hydrolase CwlJ-like protein